MTDFLKNFDSKLNELKNVITVKNNEINVFNKTLREKINVLKDLIEKLNGAIRNINALKSEYNNKQKAEEVAKVLIKSLQEKNAALEESLKRKTNESFIDKNAIAELQKKIEENNNNTGKAQEDLRSLQEKNKMLLDKIVASTGSIAEIMNTLNEARIDQTTLQELDQLIQKLTTTLQFREGQQPSNVTGGRKRRPTRKHKGGYSYKKKTRSYRR